MLLRMLSAGAVGLTALLSVNVALAQECHRGTLDKRYCDRNYDQVADLPTDSSKWVNPSTIIFSYTPVEDPAVYAKVWDGFIKHMSKVTGKKVVFFPVQSFPACSFCSIPIKNGSGYYWFSSCSQEWQYNSIPILDPLNLENVTIRW